MKDLYALLGVGPGASSRGIRDAYWRKAKEHHPDRSGEPGGDRFREIREAYDILSDPDKRREYDRSLNPPPTPSARDREWTGLGPEPLRPGPEPPGGRRVLDYTLYLSPAEAARGGGVPLELPLESICPACRGGGWRGGRPCPICQGTGRASRMVRLSLHVPPGLIHGQVLTLDLGSVGLPGTALRIRAVISPGLW